MFFRSAIYRFFIYASGKNKDRRSIYELFWIHRFVNDWICGLFNALQLQVQVPAARVDIIFGY